MGTINILLIGPDAREARRIRAALLQAWRTPLNVRYFPTREAALLASADSDPFDVILVAANAPHNFDLMADFPDTPVILLTEQEPAPQASEHIMAGFTEYLCRNEIETQAAQRVIYHLVESSRAQRELGTIRQQIRSALVQNPEGTIVSGHDAVIYYANPAAEALLNSPPGQLVGKTLSFRLAPGEVVEHDIASIPARTVELRSISAVWEGKPVYITTIRDITEQRRRERALRQAVLENSRLVAAISHLPVGIAITEPTLPKVPIVYANPAYSAITGYAPQEIIGRSPKDLHGRLAPSEIQQSIEQAIANGQPWSGVIQNYRKDGTPFQNSLVLAPFHDEDGTLLNYVELVSDVTERMKTLADLQHRLEIERLIADISTNFIKLPSNRVDEAINLGLRTLGKFLGRVERIYLATLSDDRMNVTASHEWRAEGVPSAIDLVQNLSAAALPWWHRKIQRGEVVYIPNPAALPPEASQERALLERDGICTVLDIPMNGEASFQGYISFESIWQPREWSEADIAMLGVVGEIFVSALERKHAESVLQESEAAERQQRMLAEALRNSASAITKSLDLDDVMNRILDNVGLVVPHDAATIIVMEHDGGRVAYTRGRYEAIVERIREIRFTRDLFTVDYMIRTGKPCLIADCHASDKWVILEDLAWIRSYLGAPIRSHDAVIGFLNLDCATPNFYTTAHAERLQAFADQVAIAIQNAQLFEQVRRHADELEERVRERTIALEEQHACLNAILDSMTEGVVYGILTTDNNIDLEYVNPAFCKLTGYPPDEIIHSQTIAHRMVSERFEVEKFVDGLKALLIQHGGWRGDFNFTRSDGSAFEAQVSVSLVRYPDANECLNFVALVHDVSREKMIQKQKDRFIANASHELRTPLTNLKMRLYLLEKQRHLVDEHLRVMVRVANRMHELVEDLLDVSRFERGTVELRRDAVTLQTLIQNVIEIQQPHAEEKQVKLSAIMPPEPVINFLDSARITQVITNLVVNALNYTSAAGSVEVALIVEHHGDQKSHIIRVSDTGIGIPPESLSFIFDPFFRTNIGAVRGTGLGLTISREIVALHGGTITVNSTVGAGTTFTVSLPVIEPGAAHDGD